jgi:hypothetical protein
MRFLVGVANGPGIAYVAGIWSVILKIYVSKVIRYDGLYDGVFGAFLGGVKSKLR